MIKATKKETKPADFKLDGLGRVREMLKFPFVPEEREAREHIASFAAALTGEESNIERYKRHISRARKNASNYRKELEKLRATMPDVAAVSLEEATATLHTLGTLPWVDLVYLRGTSLVVRTKVGSLKTLLGSRFVQSPALVQRTEEYAEPITISLPQYEIALNLAFIGSAMSNRSEALAIRLVNDGSWGKNDGSWGKFVGDTVGFSYEPHAHWASSGGGGVSWEKICLGDYENDLVLASKKGLVEFFSEFAIYLQNSADENAYRSKSKWALWVGLKEAEKYLIRVAGLEETAESVSQKSKEMYRKYWQPEGAVEPRPRRRVQVRGEEGWFEVDEITL